MNAGSSSLKLRVLGDGDELLESHDLAGSDEMPAAFETRIDAVGHRVVHGGTRFRDPGGAHFPSAR